MLELRLRCNGGGECRDRYVCRGYIRIHYYETTGRFFWGCKPYEHGVVTPKEMWQHIDFRGVSVLALRTFLEEVENVKGVHTV